MGFRYTDTVHNGEGGLEKRVGEDRKYSGMKG